MLTAILVVPSSAELSIEKLIEAFGNQNSYKDYGQGFWDAVKTLGSTTATANGGKIEEPFPDLRELLVGIPDLIQYGQNLDDKLINGLANNYLQLPSVLRSFMESSDNSVFIHQINYIKSVKENTGKHNRNLLIPEVLDFHPEFPIDSLLTIERELKKVLLHIRDKEPNLIQKLLIFHSLSKRLEHFQNIDEINLQNNVNHLQNNVKDKQFSF
ncbi:hypothetical protein PPL_07214 [Heterostelium album PN500]|uniref:Uncharacterized protein n=1 Tax=Heterostelium pallidum (strain ATCC 26659 / Pp 5 / PN500) TaxID=670386 RepID=D3BEP9_HETP5|nr:hypothetical protein PPL_07214 [Heterostelium album PN500]EFA80380.1 hypothetical protein PPL_07214 [Heterostelium album PN500]|eukprot:XP_020432500.1 hypothetical protein PPL_07214 [Heterostelium album PN500]